MNFHSQGLHGLLGDAPTVDRTIARGPPAFAPVRPGASSGDHGAPPRRIPEEDILVIARRRGAQAEQDQPARVLPRISRRRLAVRLVLVAALIGESVFAIRTWPSTPIPVPDASSPRSMIA